MLLYRMHGPISCLIVHICWKKIEYQVIDLLYKCSCQVNCGFCNVSHDCPTLSISTSVTLRYIRGSRLPNGLSVCLTRRRSWVRFPRRHIPRFLPSGFRYAGVDLCCLSVIVTLLVGKTVSFIFINIFS